MNQIQNKVIFIIVVISLILAPSCLSQRQNNSEGATSAVIENSSIEGRRSSCSLNELSVRRHLAETINLHRQEIGRRNIYWDRRLAEVAHIHARYISSIEKMEHSDFVGRGPMDRLRLHGVNRTIVGENLTRQPFAINGEAMVEQIIGRWLTENRERGSLLHDGMSRFGASFVITGEWCYVVLLISD